MKIDRTLLQVIADYCAAGAESMAHTLMRTAHSTFVKETEDFTCQLLTPEGLTFASPRSLGATWFTGIDYGPLLPRIEQYEEGDICITSDPYSGHVATHSPDTHMWKPVFHNGELVCFVACHVHNTDVGGAVPASLSRSLTEIHQEGIRVPPTKLFSRGELNETARQFILTNVRMPSQNWGDLNAQIACVNTGERKVLEMIERFGVDVFSASMVDLLDYAEEQAKYLVRQIPDGEYFFADYADEDSVGGYPCRVALTVRIKNDAVTLDFTGSDPQLGSSLNMPTGGHERHALVTVGYILVLSTLDPNIILNSGTSRTVRAILPTGTVMNAVEPAAVGMRSLTCYLTQIVTLGAFSRALPNVLGAGVSGGPSMMNVKTRDKNGRTIMASIGPIGGGAGGSVSADGSDGSGATHSFLRNTPVEINEAEVPIRIRKYGLVRDSGGAGRFRGGLAATLEFQVFGPNSTVTARNRDRSRFASWGVLGGNAGANSRFLKNPGAPNEVSLGNTDVVGGASGEIFQIIGSGGGGYGNPFERPAQQVLRDVACGYVSIEMARSLYGVVVHEDMTLDDVDTARLRNAHATDFTGHFGYCENRLAYERVWTEPRYDVLTKLLAQLPVEWRFFVKHRLFELVSTEARTDEDVSAVLEAYDDVRRVYRELPALARLNADAVPSRAAAE